MISFNQLGNLGRLGNQMFQYAALKGIASNRGFEYCIPQSRYFGKRDPKVRNTTDNLYSTFELKYVKQGIQSVSTVEESGFAFDKNLFDSCDDNIDLYGYFQSEKYFKHIKDEVKKDFTFKDYIKVPTKKQFDKVFGDGDVISLHVRRGDYVNSKEHPTPSLKYYFKALEQLDSELSVMVFSDDIEWCKEQTIFSDERFIFSEDNIAGVDLYLQSLCKYHIIANSSFSWWGAWLADSKKTIAPQKWFGGNCSNNETKDLYLKKWYIINE